ncbi:MAG: BREX system P-loop protein BrxC, partial [Desulfamplus sp.]|nr:BREX system P-loop protein BrxC [Desulfamplus sp.]
AALRTLKGYPADLNVQNQIRLDELGRYCSVRIIKEPVLEYAITCKNCGYSLSDILNYTALVPIKDNELLNIKSNFIAEAPKPDPEPDPDPEGGSSVQPPAPKRPRKVRLSVVSQKMTVAEYRKMLNGQLQSLAGLSDTDEIELEVE